MAFAAFVGVSVTTSPATSAPSPPTVAITSPVAGSTIKGTVAVTATVRAGDGDYPSSISFFDGVNSIGSANCQSQQSCTGTINWNATGKTGEHRLTAQTTTSAGLNATTDPVTVIIESPPPTIAIAAPANGITVKGDVSIVVSGATDPSQSDYPRSIYISDGVNSVGSIPCQGQSTCRGTINWHASGLTGPHTLKARIQTNTGLELTSAPVTVSVLTPAPTVSITKPARNSPLRKTMTVAVSGATDQSQTDYPRYIEVFNGTSSIGSVSCQGQRTCAGSVVWTTTGLRGRQRLAAVIHTNAGMTAKSRAVYVGRLGRSRPKATCKLDSFTVALRKRVHGVCDVSSPAGTAVAIKYRRATGWTTVVQGRVNGAHQYRFSLRGSKRTSYLLEAFVAASRSTKPTRVRIGILRIG
jgi:hypothetical protein